MKACELSDDSGHKNNLIREHLDKLSTEFSLDPSIMNKISLLLTLTRKRRWALGGREGHARTMPYNKKEVMEMSRQKKKKKLRLPSLIVGGQINNGACLCVLWRMI